MFKCPTQHKGKGKDVLTTKEDRELPQSIATSRDEMNKGMTRKEMISLILESFSVSSKAAENHLDYLIKSKQFPELKQGGRVVSAQATTTNRTITTQKLIWTYNIIQLAWDKQAKFNGWNVCPSLLIQNIGGEDDKKKRLLHC
jgi:hypothetical protein